MSIGRIAGGVGRLTVPPAPVVQQSSGGGGGGGEFPSLSTAVPLWMGISIADLGEMYSDAGTTPATGTSVVQEWHDYFGGAWVAEAAGSDRPVLQQNQLNGQQVLNFASNKFLRIIPASNWTGTRITAYIVMIRGATATESTYALSSETAGVDFNETTSGIFAGYDATPAMFGYRAAVLRATSGTAMSSGSPYLVITRFDTVAPTHRIKTRGEGAYVSAALNMTAFDVNSFIIGAGMDGGAAGPITHHFLGKIGAVLLVDESAGLITNDEDAAIQAWFAHADRFGSGLL